KLRPEDAGKERAAEPHAGECGEEAAPAIVIDRHVGKSPKPVQAHKKRGRSDLLVYPKSRPLRLFRAPAIIRALWLLTPAAFLWRERRRRQRPPAVLTVGRGCAAPAIFRAPWLLTPAAFCGASAAGGKDRQRY